MIPKRQSRSDDNSQVASYIARVLADAPPLRDEQKLRLAELFRPSTATTPSGAA